MTPDAPLSVLQVFWPVYAVVGAGFLIAAVVIGLSAGSAAPQVIARGESGQLTLPALTEGSRGSDRVTVFAVDTAGQAPAAELRCETDDAGTGQLGDGFNGYSSRIYLDGERQLYAVAEVAPGWSSEQAVRCPGTGAVVATTGSGPLTRLAIGGLLAATGLGAVLFGVVGRSSSRRRRAELLAATATPGPTSGPGSRGPAIT